MRNLRCANCSKVTVRGLVPELASIGASPKRWNEVERVVRNIQISGSRQLLIARDLIDLEKSAENGCYFCRFVSQVIHQALHVRKAIERGVITIDRDSPRRPPSYSLDALEHEEIFIRAAKGRLQHSRPYVDSDGDLRFLFWPSLEISPCNIQLSGFPEEDFYPRKELSLAPHALADSVVHQIKQWTDDCLHTHDRCRGDHAESESAESDWKKLSIIRLIDVKASDDPSEARLVRWTDIVSPSNWQAFQFLALSYYWGPFKAHVTTEDNIAQRLKEFRLQDIPKTLSDAILITRRLEQRYLWIDSLCIIQSLDPDPKKWATPDFLDHVGIMDLVYAKALYTLAACHSEHADAGLLKPREASNFDAPDIWIPLDKSSSLQVTTPDGNESDANGLTYVTPATSGGCYTYTSRPIGHEIIESALLESRGWCFQERILSPRRLCFTELGLLWECHTMVAAETRPEGFSAASEGKLPSVMRDIKHDPGTDFESSSWRQLVEEFTARKLSKDGDRLNAFTGITNEWRKLCRKTGQCLAGIWESDLALGLSWKLDNRDGIRPVSSTAGMPTWSWASLHNYKVIYDIETASMPPEEIFKTPVRLVAAEVDTTQDGQLNDGRTSYLTLYGCVCFVSPAETESNGDSDLPENRAWDLDTEQPRKSGWTGWNARYLRLYSGQRTWEPTKHFALMLQPSGVGGTFRRVGWYETAFEDDFVGAEMREITLI